MATAKDIKTARTAQEIPSTEEGAAQAAVVLDGIASRQARAKARRTGDKRQKRKAA